MGRLDFVHRQPSKAPLPAGVNALRLFEARNPALYVPRGTDALAPTPLVVLFHGGGGSAAKILPMLQSHAEAHGFLLLAPQSVFPTWDIVIGGNGPDRARLDVALDEVASRFRLEPARLVFAGHSDGGSYALSLGLTNGRFVTHVVASSAGFLSVHQQSGAPRVFISHGTADEQIPIDRSARAHVAQLRAAGYDLTYVEHDGPHAWQPPVVEQAVAFMFDRFPRASH